MYNQIHELVGRINGQFSTTSGWTPIYYWNKLFTIEETCALFSAADGAIFGPLRDGMNLPSHEFTLCQKDKYGALILSEFAGSSQSLSGSILVNPWDVRGYAQAINEILTMHPMDKKEKHFHNYAYVTKNTGNFWAKRFLDELFSINHIGITKVPRLKYESVKSVYSNVKKKDYYY